MGEVNAISKTFGCRQVLIVKQMGPRATCRCCSALKPSARTPLKSSDKKKPAIAFDDEVPFGKWP